MSRTFRCRYTASHRCNETATIRLRLTYSIVSTPQLTRVCEAHAVTLTAVCETAGIKLERL